MIASGRLLPLCLAGAILGGCVTPNHRGAPGDGEGALGPGSPGALDAPIRTDKDVYVLTSHNRGWHGEIRYSYANRTGRTVSLLNCRGVYRVRLEKWQDGGWVLAYDMILQACLSPPIHIPPGASHEGRLVIDVGARGSNNYPKLEIDEIDGQYRLVIDDAFWNYNHDGPAWGDKLPLAERSSGAFQIVTE
jgi:hypothetical protein